MADWQAEGYHTLTPLIHVSRGDSEPILTFARAVLRGDLHSIHRADDGRIVMAEVQIGDSRLQVSELWNGVRVPPGTHHLSVYVEDVDSTFRSALAAGAVAIKEPSEMDWGDRLASVQDRGGICWHFLTATGESKGDMARHW